MITLSCLDLNKDSSNLSAFSTDSLSTNSTYANLFTFHHVSKFMTIRIDVEKLTLSGVPWSCRTLSSLDLSFHMVQNELSTPLEWPHNQPVQHI